MTKFGTAWLFLWGGMILAAAAAPADAPPSASSTASAAAPAPQQAQIPFAKKNIWNWQVVDDKTVLIQDLGRRWYKATLLGDCINLPFAERLGFDSGSTDTFDKFSAILVGGRRCQLTSLVSTTAPPNKSKKNRPSSSVPPAR